MKRFLKWFFGLFFLLVILLVGGIFALPYLVDPNEYKPDIIAQVKPHLRGRDLQIPGDVKFSIFPWLGVEVGEVVIGNAEGFVLKPFMTVAHSKAEIKFLSLFGDQPEIGALTLRDVNIYLQQDAEGRNNWSDLASTANTDTLAAKPASGFIKVANPATDAQSQTKFELPNMKIHGVHVKNMRVELDDKQSRDVLTLYKTNLDAGPLNGFNPVPVKGTFQFSSKKQEILAASAFATVLELTPQLNEFNLKSMTMNTNITGKGVQGKTIKTSLKIPDFLIETQKEKLTAKPFYLTIDNIKSEGRFSLRKFERPVIRFGWEISKLNLDELLPKIIKDDPAGKAEEKVVMPQDEAIPEVAEMVTADALDESTRLFAPLALFSGTDTQGTLKVEELIYNKLEFKKFRMNLLARANLVSALPFAELYGGKYEGDLQIQSGTKQAGKVQPTRVRTKQKLEAIPFKPIMKALYNKETISGKLYFSGQFFSTGDTQKKLTENLNGEGQFRIRDAEVRTLDLKQLILKENYDKLDFIKEKTDDKEVTVFDRVVGSIQAKHGVLYNKDFQALSRRVHLNGKGYADLNEETVKYTVTTIPKKSLAFSLGGRSIDLKNKDIDTHITGPWSNLKIDNDLENVLKEEFKQTELYQKKRAEEDKLKDKLKAEKEKLEQKLKDKLKF